MAAEDLEVLLVDDRLGVRRGLELLLREGGFRIAGTGGSEQASGLLRRRRFDVALVDATLDGVAVDALLATLLAERPRAPVVAYIGPTVAPDAIESLVSTGVPGLVLDSSAPDVLWRGLRAVAAGERFVDPELGRRLSEPRRRVVRAGTAVLSPREREVLLLLAAGSSGAEIAQRLYLSAETVRTHVRNAVRKLSARTRTHAVAMVVAAGEASPDGDRTDPNERSDLNP